MAKPETKPADVPPEKPKEGATPTPDERVAALEARLAESAAENAAMLKTLKALKGAEAPPQRRDEAAAGASYTYNPGPVDPAVRARLAQALGWETKDVDEHWKIIAAFLGEMASPLINAVGILADRTDYVQTRLKLSDYAEIEDECEGEMQSRLRAGRPASRQEIYQIVKARKMPELIERAAQDKVDAAAARAASAASAATEGTTHAGEATPGAGPAHRPDQTLTPDQFAALSLEDKERYLDGKTF
jgi:hypothetical protein